MLGNLGVQRAYEAQCLRIVLERYMPGKATTIADVFPRNFN